jgi:alpha-amylase
MLLLVFLILTTYISCKTKEEWKTRSIYQILTDRFARTADTGACNLGQYCGGNIKGIFENLDYIKGMGFNAIWISPIVENIEGAYHGYHLTNLYKLNPHFGSEADLKNLIKVCHLKDIWVMVDVVANHVAPIGTDYSRITPFNSADHYHEVCQIVDWNNQNQVENCRLCDLPDLKQENEWVTQTLYDWINKLVKDYDIDGIRIDTIMEVPKWFWDKFRDYAGVFQIGEAFNGNIDYVSDYQRHLDSVFNYPLYYKINNGFCSGSMKDLEYYWTTERLKYPEPEVTATFVENHDNARFLNKCRDNNKFTNAAIFSLLWEGVPVFYYGGEQYYSGGDDPKNREPLWTSGYKKTQLYKYLGAINKIRVQSKIWNRKIIQRYASDHFYAFSRDNILACFTNTNGVNVNLDYHPYKNGDKLCNALNTKDCITVNNGIINIKMGALPKVYIKVKQSS